MVFRPAYPPQKTNATCSRCGMPVALLRLKTKVRVLNTCGSGHIHTCAATHDPKEWEGQRIYRDVNDEKRLFEEISINQGGMVL